MSSELKEALTQIRDAVDDVEAMLSARMLADPSAMYIEPDAGEPGGRRGPSVHLRCHDHPAYAMHFAWGGGGRVSMTDLAEEFRKHMDGNH